MFGPKNPSDPDDVLRQALSRAIRVKPASKQESEAIQNILQLARHASDSALGFQAAVTGICGSTTNSMARQNALHLGLRFIKALRAEKGAEAALTEILSSFPRMSAENIPLPEIFLSKVADYSEAVQKTHPDLVLCGMSWLLPRTSPERYEFALVMSSIAYCTLLITPGDPKRATAIIQALTLELERKGFTEFASEIFAAQSGQADLPSQGPTGDGRSKAKLTDAASLPLRPSTADLADRSTGFGLAVANKYPGKEALPVTPGW